MCFVKCRVADFNISFEDKIKNIDVLMRNFVCEYEKPDLILSVSDDDVKQEVDIGNLSPGSVQRLAVFRKLAQLLPERNAFVLHSACFDVEGTGVAFAAHSGTGKTTHMNLWQEYLGKKMTIVNGDKPIVRFFDNEPETPYAYGTPWNGKEHLGCNMRTKLKHICFIERSETNFVEKVEKSEIIDRIFKQVYMPTELNAITKTIELADRLLNCCDLWIIHCNMEKDAGKIAYETIFRP